MRGGPTWELAADSPSLCRGGGSGTARVLGLLGLRGAGDSPKLARRGAQPPPRRMRLRVDSAAGWGPFGLRISLPLQVPELPGALLRRPFARRGRRGPVGGGLHPAGAPPGLGPGRLLSPGAPPAARLLPGALQQSHLQEPAGQSLPQRGLLRLLRAAPGCGRGKSVGVRRGEGLGIGGGRGPPKESQRPSKKHPDGMDWLLLGTVEVAGTNSQRSPPPSSRRKTKRVYFRRQEKKMEVLIRSPKARTSKFLLLHPANGCGTPLSNSGHACLFVPCCCFAKWCFPTSPTF